MASVMKLEKNEMRAIIFYNFKKGVKPIDCHREMSGVLEGYLIPSYTQIKFWYNEFKRGKLNLNDDHRSGRPKTADTSENRELLKDHLRSNPNSTVRRMKEVLGVGTAAVSSLLHNQLMAKKICPLFIPHDLTIQQKQARIKWCREMLDKFDNGRSKRVYQIVTGDETLIYFFENLNRAQSKVWVFEGDPNPTLVRQPRNVDRRTFAIFFRRSGLVARVMVNKNKTVNANWYSIICLSVIIEELKKCRKNESLRGYLLHYDNASAHTAGQTLDYIFENDIDLMGHPPYSPDLALNDFWLFPKIKPQLKGKKYQTEEELVSDLDRVLGTITKEEWAFAFDDWFRRMKLRIKVKGEYFENL